MKQHIGVLFFLILSFVFVAFVAFELGKEAGVNKEKTERMKWELKQQRLQQQEEGGNGVWV